MITMASSSARCSFSFSHILLFQFYFALILCSPFVFFRLDRERSRLSCHTCDWLRDGWYSGQSSALFKAHSGTEAPCHLPLYLSRTAPCSRQPLLPRIFSLRFCFYLFIYCPPLHAAQPWLLIHSLAFHSHAPRFVFVPCISLLQTVHHRLIQCPVILYAFAFCFHCSTKKIYIYIFFLITLPTPVNLIADGCLVTRVLNFIKFQADPFSHPCSLFSKDRAIILHPLIRFFPLDFLFYYLSLLIIPLRQP